jgi:tetratricopeptide (TPR) repeat protein
MVGVGTFEAYRPYDAAQLPSLPNAELAPTHFVVRQLFMRNPAEECALLVALAELLARCEMTVTFNGRSFDLPLLRLRYTQNRRFLPLDREVELLHADRAHLDLLMPARRVWRRRLQSCRLINLEQMILGLERAEDDVPGYLIPDLYHEYVHSGHVAAMRRVFYHNNEDIVTMVALADHLGRAFGETPAASPSPSLPNHPALPSSVTGMDWLGLGHAHARAGDDEQAIAAYDRALESVRNPSERGDIYRALGDIYKRRRQWAEAVETWNLWITSVSSSDPTPYVELAKYHEWETRDLEQAEMWTGWALHNLRQAHPAARRPADQRSLEQRLVRLQRKRGTAQVAHGDTGDGSV